MTCQESSEHDPTPREATVLSRATGRRPALARSRPRGFDKPFGPASLRAHVQPYDYDTLKKKVMPEGNSTDGQPLPSDYYYTHESNITK